MRLNARNEHDRSKFVEDLRESVAEMDEMEALRLEAELEKQRASITSVPSSPGALASVGAGGGGDGGGAGAGTAATAAGGGGGGNNIANGDARKGHHAGSKHSNGGPVMRKQVRKATCQMIFASSKQQQLTTVLPHISSPSPMVVWCSVDRPSTTPYSTCLRRRRLRRLRGEDLWARSTPACPSPSSRRQ